MLDNTNGLTYLEAGTELERLISEIESGGVDNNILSGKVERATHLVKFCRSELEKREEVLKSVLSEREVRAEPDEPTGTTGLEPY